jgi:hypothetical protein
VPAGSRDHDRSPGTWASTALAIDDLRISSVARAPEESGFHQAPLQPDPQTLLLLDFEEAVGGMVRPAVMVRADGPAEFAIEGGRIVEGKAGRGLALTTSEAGEGE